MNNPVPEGLVGVLTPESGEWWAVLTYRDIGCVKGARSNPIDAAAILKSISDRAQQQNESRIIHNLPPIDSVTWKQAPVFDAKTHTVEWAVEVKTQSSEVVNHTVCLLGRRGVLDATVVEPYQFGTDLVPLRELMKNISFKPGQLYTDFQKGDTVSGIGLAELIAGADDISAASKSAVAAAAKGAGWSWYEYVGVGVVAGAGALVLRGALRRRHSHKKPREQSALAAISNGNGIGNGRQIAHERIALSGVSGNGHGAKDGQKRAVVGSDTNHRAGAHRKKIFDYHRFYTDTVLKLSSGSYSGISSTNGRSNGNGHVAGNTATSQPPTHGEANQALVQAHLDLIANQNALIEEQKRLMIQQAKLIDEKSKLIAEKSQLLDRQTDLFERDLL